MAKLPGENIPSGYRKASVQTYTPEMMDLWKQSMGNLGPDSFLSQIAGGDQSAFAEMEQPALKQFGELQGNMASRFSGFGLGGRHGSGFQNTMNQAGADFAKDLQSKRLEMRMNAIKELQGMSSDMLKNNPYDTALVEKNKPWWQEALVGIGQEGAREAIKSGFKGASAAQ